MINRLLIHFYDGNNFVGAGFAYPHYEQNLSEVIKKICNTRVKDLSEKDASLDPVLHDVSPNASMRVMQIIFAKL